MSHLDTLNHIVTEHGRDYQTFIFVGHFNISFGEKSVILFNRPANFQHVQVFETGLCEFHRMIAAEFKMVFPDKIGTGNDNI